MRTDHFTLFIFKSELNGVYTHYFMDSHLVMTFA